MYNILPIFWDFLIIPDLTHGCFSNIHFLVNLKHDIWELPI